MNAIIEQTQAPDQSKIAARKPVMRIRLTRQAVGRPEIIAIHHPLTHAQLSPDWRGVPDSALHD